MLWNVLLVDEHEVSRMGARLALGKSYFQVRADVSTFSEATSCLRDEEIDLVLLDLPLVKNRGFDLLEHIQRHYPDVPAVILTAHDNPTFIARAAILKATGYLMKNAPVNTLCGQLVSIMADESRTRRGVLGGFEVALRRRITSSALPAGFPLTPRETQVLRHLALGLSNKEIAFSLNVSIETVKEHVQRVIRKTNATGRTDVAVRTVKSGILQDIPRFGELGVLTPELQDQAILSTA